jgi:hypothetical protein
LIISVLGWDDVYEFDVVIWKKVFTFVTL